MRALSFAAAALALLPAVAGCAIEEKKVAAPAEVVYPPAPEEPRVRWLGQIARQEDIGAAAEDSRLADALAGQESTRIELGKPHGVAVTADECIYVCDVKLGEVIVFDRRRQKVRRIGFEGEGKLTRPNAVAVAPSGTIFVSDVAQKRVKVYDQSGTYLFAIGRLDEFANPTGLALDPDRGRLAVVDTHRHKVRVYDLTGKLVSEIGGRGSEDGLFNFPTSITIDRVGRLWVADTLNFRIQCFSPEGKFLKKWGKLGDGYGDFVRPKGIAVDSDGHVYVVDGAYSQVKIFDPDGVLLLLIGGWGVGPGELWLPTGLCIDQRDRIYVADPYNARIQTYQYLGMPAHASTGPKPAKTP